MEVRLRSECQSLLEKLKSSQLHLTDHVNSQVENLSITADSKTNLEKRSDYIDPIINYNLSRNVGKKRCRQKFGADITSDVNVSKDADTDLKPVVARSKLYGLTKGGKPVNSALKKDIEKENIEIKQSNLSAGDKSTHEISTRDSSNPSSWQPATPNRQQRRQLINKHTSVPTKLSEMELRDLDNERNLNFNYSYINVDDNVAQLLNGQSSTQTSSNHSPEFSASDCSDRDLVKISEDTQKNFESKLLDDGNNRKLNKFVKEATMKPKSILNSTGYYSLNSSRRNNSRVRFNSSQSSATLPDQRLLGYDWIAALLDNDSNMVDQSESFFDDLRDFRKAHKDECSNQFYMESPHTLVDTEPCEIGEALAEPKVRPYIVNERLFTEPFKSNLLPNVDDDVSQIRDKQPTKENPRFVRVSIPRSTLQTPYRVKPHRRRSFDSADSCSLMDHCLLGWENTRPETLPAASSLDLNTEAGTRQDSVVTSLAEAEQLATAHRHGAWPFPKPQGHVTTLPSWRKHYTDTTLNLSQPPSWSTDGGKRATDRLLRATYSNMYEMERLRQAQELEGQKEEKLREAWRN